MGKHMEGMDCDLFGTKRLFRRRGTAGCWYESTDFINWTFDHGRLAGLKYVFVSDNRCGDNWKNEFISQSSRTGDGTDSFAGFLDSRGE